MNATDDAASPVLRLLIGGLITAATGIVTTLLPVITAHVSGAETLKRKGDELDLLVKRIAAWKSWLDAASVSATPRELTSARRLVEPHLASIAEQMANTTGPSSPADEGHLRGMSWPRRFFLLYPPQHRPGWVTRFFFYAFVVILFVLVKNSWQDGSFRDWLSWALLLFLIALGSLLRLSALRADLSRN